MQCTTSAYSTQQHILETLGLLYTSRGLCSNHTDQLLHAVILAQEQQKSTNHNDEKRSTSEHQLVESQM